MPNGRASSKILGAFASAHPNHKRIAGGAVVIGALTIVAKSFAAAREMAIAWRFGVGTTVDAYQLALTITTWLPMMLTSVMTVVLVPRLVSLSGGREWRSRFIAELNGTVLALGVAAAALTWLAAPATGRLLGGTIDPERVQLTREMARGIAPVALFSIVIGYLSARLQARERFVYTVTEAIPALVIAGLVILPLTLGGGPRLIWGTILGFLIQLLILATMVRRSEGTSSFTFRHRSPEWRSLYGDLAYMAAGQMVLALSIPLDQAFAARLGPGAVATLGYASRILVLLSGLATIVVGRALLPVLSRTVAEGDLIVGRRQAFQWACLLFGAAALGSAILWLLAPMLVRLLFQRGAFGNEAVAQVSTALRFGLFQLPFYYAGMALVQWFAALNRFRDILMITLAALSAKAMLNVILVPSYGVGGIMLSTATMYCVTFALLVSRLRSPSAPSPDRFTGSGAA